LSTLSPGFHSRPFARFGCSSRERWLRDSTPQKVEAAAAGGSVFSTFPRRALGASDLSMLEAIGALGRLDVAAMLIDDGAGTLDGVSRVIALVARESGRKCQPRVVEAEEGKSTRNACKWLPIGSCLVCYSRHNRRHGPQRDIRSSCGLCNCKCGEFGT
jgi:hypothetical protein